MLTTGHVVFCEMYVSVDKLVALPILCVEQLVLHECFSECHNLSVEICSHLTLSFLGHDCLYWAGLLTICYAVVGQEPRPWILVFLCCCSFESYRLF